MVIKEILFDDSKPNTFDIVSKAEEMEKNRQIANTNGGVINRIYF